MKKKEIKHPDKKVSTGAYSAGVLVDDWLYISGQGSLDLSNGEIIHGTIEDETLLTLSHIEKILQAEGGTRDNIIKCTVHLSDIKNFDKFNAAYASFFQGVKPARTTVQSGLSDGLKVEIDAIAKM